MFPLNMMRRTRLIGLLLALVGLALIIVGGLWKPTTVLRWSQWKARMAPVHLAWMVGLVSCAFGLILILRDTFLSNDDRRERDQGRLRVDITKLLPATNLSQGQLNALIAERYSKSGLLSLNVEELREVRSLLEQKVSDRPSL